MDHTPGDWELEIGEDRCFHSGNRVAITVSGEEDGEPYNVTIAELWPAENDMDIKDGRLMSKAPKLLEVLKLFMDDVPCRLDHHGVCQTHSMMNPCEMKLARDVIEEIEKPILKRRNK